MKHNKATPSSPSVETSRAGSWAVKLFLLTLAAVTLAAPALLLGLTLLAGLTLTRLILARRAVRAVVSHGRFLEAG